MKTSRPSSVKMLARALDPLEHCLIVLTHEGFRAVPESIHVPRPTALTMRAPAFVREIVGKSKLPLSRILSSADPETILQTLAQEIYRDKCGAPPVGFQETRGRVW